MARRLTTNRQIDAFIRKVIGDANHHAPSVSQVIMPLSQAVRAILNLAQDRVEVIERLGNRRGGRRSFPRRSPCSI